MAQKPSMLVQHRNHQAKKIVRDVAIAEQMVCNLMTSHNPKRCIRNLSPRVHKEQLLASSQAISSTPQDTTKGDAYLRDYANTQSLSSWT
jgi:hypothetical protein